MNRRIWLVTILAVTLLFGLLLWRARHRIHALLNTAAEQQKQQGLQIEADDQFGSLAADPLTLTDSDWPWWRGLQHNNHASDPAPPLTWSETDNVLWKVPVPGRGHSSPCVLGDRIFLTTAVEEAGTQFALSFDANTGRILWQRQVHQGKFIHQNQKNTQASSTVATDGHQLFCLFAVDNAIWLSCLALDGSIVWQREVGPYVSKEGFGASPLILEDAIIVAADNMNQSWIAAVHRTTGDILWRTPRGSGTSYASPGIISYEGQRLIVMGGLNKIVGIQPRTGIEVWDLPGPDLSASTPVEGDGMLFVTSCTQDSGLFGVRLSNPPQIAWRRALKDEVPSPLYDNGLVYFALDLGILICCEAETGDQLWRQRLGSNITASPVLSGDHILVSLEDGRTIVLKTGRSFLQVSENKLDESLYSTPAISRSRLYLRSLDHLYAIGHPSLSEDAASAASDEGK